MHQWVAEIAYETRTGPKTVTESFYLPTIDDVRKAISKKGGYALKIRPHSRSPLERLLARSAWWQVQLLRGIQFRSTSTSPGVALWKIIEAETNPRRQNILAPAREALARGLGVIDALKALNIFDHGTLAILAGSERANRLQEGIPHAIQSITEKAQQANPILTFQPITISKLTKTLTSKMKRTENQLRNRTGHRFESKLQNQFHTQPQDLSLQVQ